MKRIFVRAGVSLVGLMAWLLPNQAKAHSNCSIAVGGETITWSCPSADQCIVIFTFYNDGTFSFITGCA